MTKIYIKFLKDYPEEEDYEITEFIEINGDLVHYNLSNYFNEHNPYFPSKDTWDRIEIVKDNEVDR